MLDCEKRYDSYNNEIESYNNSERYLTLLKSAAEKVNPAESSGYAASLLFDLYTMGKYVNEDMDLAEHYLQLGCAAKEAISLTAKAQIDSETGEEYDKKLEEVIENGCNREYLVWYLRSSIRSRKSSFQSNTFKPNVFLRIKYLRKAIKSIPKQKYFDFVRRLYKKKLRKLMAVPIALIALLLVIVIITSIA